MLHLIRETTNELNLVCKDLVVIEDPFYLFRFVNTQSEVESLIYLANLTPGNPRFDKFSINLPDDLDLVAGKYEFWVYESEDEEEDYEGKRILANGRADVAGTESTDTTYEPTGTDKVYKPQ